MNVGYEKVLLLQNDLNMSASDIIATYVYRQGLEGAQYSFSAAVGLFNSVVQHDTAGVGQLHNQEVGRDIAVLIEEETTWRKALQRTRAINT